MIWDTGFGYADECDHDFISSIEPSGTGDGVSFRRDRKAGRKRGGHQPGFCSKCGAWKGCLGLEPDPYLYIKHLVEIFQEVKRVLRKDGTCFINMGDSYAACRSYQVSDNKHPSVGPTRHLGRAVPPMGFKQKDLLMLPARLAIALQADGWYLRSQIPWIKRNCKPESTKDRPTTAVEYFFLLSKSRKYFYDHEGIKLPASPDTHARYGRGIRNNTSYDEALKEVVDTRARRNSDWFFESLQGLLSNEEGDPLALMVNSVGFSGAHYATYPPKLVEPCILAGCPRGGTVLDPFAGSGTTCFTAEKLGRRWIGIDMDCSIGKERIDKETMEGRLF